jgi:hypothetical protein
MTDPQIAEIAAAIENGTGADNALDVRIEVALFKPDAAYKAVRANDAGTKCIYTMADGSEVTCWAPDWTMDREYARQSVAAYLKEQSNV